MKNFKYVLLLLLFLLTQSCSTTKKIYYELLFQDVETPSKKIKEINKVLPITIDEADYYEFEDEIIKIQWFPTYQNFGFRLWNKSNENFKVIWDDAAMVDSTGESNRVMHSETKFIKSDETQMPTTVIKGSYIDELVYPTTWSYYRPRIYLGKGVSIPGEWKTPPTFIEKITTSNLAETKSIMTNELVNKNIKILLPIKIGNKTQEYLFNFKIANIRFSMIK